MDSYPEKRKNKILEHSRNTLHQIFNKRIKTTMIGALSSIEEHFGFLWDDNSAQKEYFADLYQKLRSETLDKGNAQLRSLESDINKFDISPKIYSLRMPVRLDIKEKEDE